MTASQLSIGTRLQQYEIVGRLGKGGMGEVFRARDLRLDREVAIKLLSDEMANDASMRDRFEHEARTIAALAHPGIVSVHELGVVDDRAFLVMELLEGESLRERLGQGPFPVPAALDVALQMAAALGAVHGKGIVHRDLKPENVFMVSGGRVKLLDFGIAHWSGLRHAGGQAYTMAWTIPGQILGTVGYLAPELLRGEAIGVEADIFSLGCVLGEMLTGAPLFGGGTPAETLAAVLTAEPTGLSNIESLGGPRLRGTIARMLEKQPGARQRSAAQVAGELESLTPRPTVSPAPTTLPTPSAQYDLVVIGSGPAGQRGAVAAAKLGKRVCVVDKSDRLGGVSLHSGTLPSKTLRESVLYLSGFQQRTFYGRSYRLKEQIVVADLAPRTRTVIEREADVVRNQLRRNGIDIVDGHARFLSPHLLEVSGPPKPVVVEAANVLIACGSRPAVSSTVVIDNQRIFDTDGLKRVERLPRDLIVVGGGVIGLEYASIATALDARVTIVDQRPAVLDFVDEEIVEALSYHLRRRGATLRLGEKVVSVRSDATGVHAGLESGKSVSGDALLYAVGRQGNADSLNLPAAGIEVDARGRLAVNDHFQTSVPHIYAAGDVLGFPALASVSMEQGRRATCHMFGRASGESPLLPYGIYTIPEISMVGQTERQLTDERVPYEVGMAKFEDLAKGQMVGDDTGFLKILFDPVSLRVLGIHVIGTNAAELIHLGQAVMALGGTVGYLRDAVFNHPTLAEAYKLAALNGLNKIASN